MSFRLISAALTVSFLAIANSANAQLRFSVGPQVGINSSWASYVSNTQRPYQSYSADVNHRTGISAGITTILYGKHFALQPTASINTTRFQVIEALAEFYNGNTFVSSYNTDYRFVYLQIPVNIIYFLKPNKDGLQVFLGGYGGLLLGGKITHNNHFRGGNSSFDYISEGNISSSVHNQFSADNFYAKHFDIGLRGGLGYKYNRFLLQAHYQVGFLNISKFNIITVDVPNIKHRTLGIDLSYLIFNKMVD